MFTDRFVARRAALTRVCPGWAFLLPARPSIAFGRGHFARSRPDGDLMYLSGIGEPGAVMVLRADGRSILYAEVPDDRLARWTGARPSLDALASISGVDEARPVELLFEELQGHLDGADALAYRLGRPDGLDAPVLAALSGHSRGSRARVLLPVHDPAGAIAELRIIKEPCEIDAMRRAARITAAAHVDLMRGARIGDSALALCGAFEAACLRAGAGQVSYESIVGIGPDATVLHARPGARRLVADDLVLVDAAAAGVYACDVTRTWPARRFGPAAGVYEAVLAAQLAALDAIAPGVTFRQVHQTAVAVLAERAQALGLPGPIERWFPHKTGHWIGIDTHDPGWTVRDGASRVLQPGMALTVEPGLYIDVDASEAPSSLRGIGVRIEDTVVVTQTGVEVLTDGIPKDVSSIEAARARAST